MAYHNKKFLGHSYCRSKAGWQRALPAVLTQAARLIKGSSYHRLPCSPKAGKGTTGIAYWLVKTPPGSDARHFCSHLIGQGKSCGHTQLQKGSEYDPTMLGRYLWTTVMPTTNTVEKTSLPWKHWSTYSAWWKSSLHKCHTDWKQIAYLISHHHWVSPIIKWKDSDLKHVLILLINFTIING